MTIGIIIPTYPGEPVAMPALAARIACRAIAGAGHHPAVRILADALHDGCNEAYRQALRAALAESHPAAEVVATTTPRRGNLNGIPWCREQLRQMLDTGGEIIIKLDSDTALARAGRLLDAFAGPAVAVAGWRWPAPGAPFLSGACYAARRHSVAAALEILQSPAGAALDALDLHTGEDRLLTRLLASAVGGRPECLDSWGSAWRWDQEPRTLAEALAAHDCLLAHHWADLPRRDHEFPLAILRRVDALQTGGLATPPPRPPSNSPPLLLCGIGPGRCGTRSLAWQLSSHPQARLTHEASGPIPLDARRRALAWWRERLTKAEGEGWAVVGDVALWWTHHAEALLDAFGDRVRIVGLGRESAAVARSYAQVQRDQANHWSPTDSRRLRNRWSPAYPVFPGLPPESLAAGARLWARQCRAACQAMAAAFPERVRLVETATLSYPDTALDLFRWLGLDPEAAEPAMLGAHLNAGQDRAGKTSTATLQAPC